MIHLPVVPCTVPRLYLMNYPRLSAHGLHCPTIYGKPSPPLLRLMTHHERQKTTINKIRTNYFFSILTSRRIPLLWRVPIYAYRSLQSRGLPVDAC